MQKLFIAATLLLAACCHAPCVTGAAEPARLPHPALAHDLDPAGRPAWEAAAAPLLARSEAELRGLVPRQTPFITCDCPSCGAHTYTRSPDRILWEYAFPDRLTCRACKTSFPNDRFPNNQTAAFLNTLGESIDVPCYADAAGRRYYLTSTIDSWRHAELLKQLEASAKLHALTRDDRYALPVVVSLAEYAEHFPHYLVKDFLTTIDAEPGPRGAQRSRYEFVSTGGPWKVAGRPRGSRPSEPAASQESTSTPYGWTQSRWGWRRWEGETPLELLKVYDLIYDSPTFETLAAERGHDVRRRIEERLFRNAASYLLDFPFWYHVHNNAGKQVAEIVRTGMVLGEPSYAEFGRRWGRSVLEQYAFSRDAAFGESPGYFYVFLATQADNFAALKEAAAYFGKGSDADADGAARTAEANRAIEFLDRSQTAIESVRFPNGSSLPISDNRHDEFADPTYRPGVRGTPRLTSTDTLLPGYGHALLGAGTGDRQIQAHLHFSPFKEVIHTHADGLSLMLWAFGSELYTDIGYNRTKYRPWASTTLSHNTVVVDRKRQDGPATKGRMSAYESDPRGWSFVAVEDAGAYGPPVSRYRRSLILNSRDPESPYVIDVFEVRGGQVHDYALHGPTVFDSNCETDCPLEPMPGERPLLSADEAAAFDPATHAYGQFTGVRRGAPQADFMATFRLVDPYKLPAYTANSRYPAGKSFHYEVDPKSYADQGEIGVRSRFLSVEGRPAPSLFLGETPSLLRGGLIGSPLTDQLRRPSVLVRHAGTEPLSSIFVVVHEPYYRSPKIISARRLATTEPTAVAMEITLADRVDTVLLSLDGDRVTVAPGSSTSSASLEGRLAIIERPKQKAPLAWLVGGTKVTQADFSLANAPARYTGEIDGVTSVWDGANENAFVTSVELPEGTALAGRWMIVHHGAGESAADEGYRIARVERRDGRSVIHLTDDPGLRITPETTEEIFFPRRRWQGPNRFTILSTAGR